MQVLPELVEPPLLLPSWVPPQPPPPIGFIAGCAPLLLLDVSGSMHPARQGQLLRVKQCCHALLDPTEGELMQLHCTQTMVRAVVLLSPPLLKLAYDACAFTWQVSWQLLPMCLT